MKYSPHSVSNRRLFALATLAVLAGPAGATGFRLPDQDAFATARGEAFAATADNPSAIFYNPAGITQLDGQQFRAGVYGIKTDSNFTSPAGQEFDNLHDLHAIPQFFYTVKPDGRSVAFGLGIYSPFGLSNEWPDNTGFRTLGLRGRLTYLTINPVVAWEVLPGLSLAAGPTAARLRGIETATARELRERDGNRRRRDPCPRTAECGRAEPAPRREDPPRIRLRGA